MSRSSTPLTNRVAIVGLGRVPFGRDLGRSPSALALDAAVAAVRDSGLNRDEIDGIVGSPAVPAHHVQAGLGLARATWWANLGVPFTAQIMAAAAAIGAGFCSTVLAYHVMYRTAGTSREAAADPYRERFGPGTNILAADPDSIHGATAYAAWASRYLHEFSGGGAALARIAVSGRCNARQNPVALLREPLTFDDYHASPMVRDPLRILDMEVPVDGADAFVITHIERARDLPHRPVLLDAATLGMTGAPDELQAIGITSTGLDAAAAALWERTDVRLPDIDVFFPYDGFSIIALRWFEAIGYCGDGDAPAYLAQNWDHGNGRLMLDGRVPVNPHGGSLSEGGSQGSGHIREAALQLRGDAGARQVDGATLALVVTGGFFFNAGAMVLRGGVS